VIGLFLVSGAATTIPMTTLPRRAARDARVLAGSPLALLLVILFFAGAASTLAFFPRETVTAAGEHVAPAPTQNQTNEFERWYSSQPRVPLIIPSDGAKVLVVKFNDFQCPACGQSYQQYKPVFAKYDAQQPGAVRLVLKDYPLNRDCNDNMMQTLHPAACDAAVAVRLTAPAKAVAQAERRLTGPTRKKCSSKRKSSYSCSNTFDVLTSCTCHCGSLATAFRCSPSAPLFCNHCCKR